MTSEQPPKREPDFWRKWGKNLAFFALLFVLFFTDIGKEISVFIRQFTLSQPTVSSTTATAHLADQDFNWQLTNADGQSVSFADFKGKVVFLNFWATWCMPCRAEFPSITKLHERYGDQVAFVLVSTEETAVTNSFLAEKALDIPSYTLFDEVPSALYSRTIPATFIIDQEGGLVLAERGAVNWNGDNVTGLLDEMLTR